jgi:hypothetical protein
VAAVLAAPALVLGMSSPSFGRPVERGEIHDTFHGSFADFCDEPGLNVTLDNTFDGTFTVKTHGADQIGYYAEHTTFTQRVTNDANGKFTRVVERTINKDLRITDNHDGTVTIIVLATGGSTLYDMTGKAIARNPGQVRFRIVFSDNGTPDFPDDDYEVSFEQIKGSTGRSDDYCAATVAAIA